MVTRFGDGRDWFFETLACSFISLYAIPAWHEQTLYRKGMTRDDMCRFNSSSILVRFDPDVWLDLAEKRSTSALPPNIEGFCMWDTAQTDYIDAHALWPGHPGDAGGGVPSADSVVPVLLYCRRAQPNYPNQGRSMSCLPRLGRADRKSIWRSFRHRCGNCANYGVTALVDANILLTETPRSAMIRVQPGRDQQPV